MTDKTIQSNGILRKMQHNITLHQPITNRSKSNPRRFSGQSAAQDGLTCLQPHRTSLRLFRQQATQTDSLTCSLAGPLRNSGQPAAQDGLTRLKLHWIKLHIFTDRLPRHPNASSRLPRTHRSWSFGRHHMDPAQHRQHNRPTPQCSSTLVVSSLSSSSPKPSSPQGVDVGTPTCHRSFPYSVLCFTSQLSFLCLHTHIPICVIDN